MSDQEGSSEIVSEATGTAPTREPSLQTAAAGDGVPSVEDPDNYPLSSSWSFWLYKNSDAGNFFSNLRHLASVNTIKEFWSVYNNLPAVSELQDRDTYHLMRDKEDSHRRPVWEDLDNVDGGTWTVKVSKESTVQLWQELLLAAVGEQLSRCVSDEDEVCGVSVSCRLDSDVLTVWHQDSALHQAATIFDQLRVLVPGVGFKTQFYQANRNRVRDSMSRSSARNRSPHPTGHKPHVTMTTGRSSPGHQRASGAVRAGASSACHRYPTPTLPPPTAGILPVPHNQPHPHFHGYQPVPQVAGTSYSVRAPGNASLPGHQNTGTVPHPQ